MHVAVTAHARQRTEVEFDSYLQHFRGGPGAAHARQRT